MSAGEGDYMEKEKEKKTEKFIIERKSTVKGKEDSIVAFVVYIPYYEFVDGKKHRKYYNRSFNISDYVSSSKALDAAVRERNHVLPLLKGIEKIPCNNEMEYTADEILALLPSTMRMIILNEMEKKHEEKGYENHTVQELFDKIPDHYSRRQATYRHMGFQYKKYIKEDFADKLITDITVADVMKSLNACAEVCAREYVSKLKSLWGKIFSVALMLGIPVTNWSDVVDLPSSDKHTERSLSEQNITEEDFQKFCEFMSHYGNYAPIQKKQIFRRDIILYMLRFMRFTGVRSAEAKALSRKNINFRNIVMKNDDGIECTVEVAEVRIESETGSTRTEMNTIRETKTPQSVRTVPVGPEGAKMLRKVLAYHDYDLVFCDYNGGILTTSLVCGLLANVSKKCGIKVYTLLMRKSLSADYYAQRVNPAVTKKMMGHKNEEMSLNAYASASDEDVFEAMMNRKYKQ
jgi:integrase